MAEVPGWKRSSQNLWRSEVFPTLEFPTRTILKRRSGAEGPPSSWTNSKYRRREEWLWKHLLQWVNLPSYSSNFMLRTEIAELQLPSALTFVWFITRSAMIQKIPNSVPCFSHSSVFSWYKKRNLNSLLYL